MYLTKIVVPNSLAAQLNFFDPYQWHKALWECFSSAKKRPFIFRVDQDRNQITFLMQSLIQPLVQPWGLWQTKIVPKSFFEKDKYLFSLRAYPAFKKSIYKEDGTRERQGIRVPHMEPEKWLCEKAEENGFTIEGVSIIQRHNQTASKGFHVAVDFQGVLTVKNKELFLTTITNGVGPSKAYGMGLFLLKPY